MRRGAGFALASLAFACAGVAAPGLARAGAWTQAEGAGQVIFTSGRRAAPGAFATSALPEEDSVTASVYLEYGLLPTLTLGGAAYTDVNPADARDGSAALAVFARQRLWRRDAGDVLSVQLGYSHPAEFVVSAELAASQPTSTPEIQARILYGRGFWGDWGTAFVNAEIGFHWKSEGAADEFRGDLTGGVAPWRCCSVGLALFSLMPFGSGTDASVKLSPRFTYTPQPSTARNAKKDFSQGRTSYQLGMTYDLLNGEDGVGVQFSIIRRF